MKYCNTGAGCKYLEKLSSPKDGILRDPPIFETIYFCKVTGEERFLIGDIIYAVAECNLTEEYLNEDGL